MKHIAIGSMWRFTNRPALFDDADVTSYCLLAEGTIVVVIDPQVNKFGRVKVLVDNRVGSLNENWFTSSDAVMIL